MTGHKYGIIHDLPYCSLLNELLVLLQIAQRDLAQQTTRLKYADACTSALHQSSMASGWMRRLHVLLLMKLILTDTQFACGGRLTSPG